MKKIEEIFSDFWSHHPSLLYALAALFGFILAIRPTPEVFIPLFFLGLPAVFGLPRFRLQLLFSLAIMVAMYGYSHTAFHLPEVSSQGNPGTIHFAITSVSSSQSHFAHQWNYQGRVKTFSPDQGGASGKNFPCSLRLSKKALQQRPLADRSYIIHGVLKKTSRGSYFFQVRPETPWYGVQGSWSFAEWRYLAKQFIKRTIYQKIPDRQVAEFLSGIVTGEFEDQMMRTEFSKLGLQHIMAISGFHFALVAGMLSFLLRGIFPHSKLSTWILIVLLSSYFLFLGPSPSICRAWIMCIVVLFSPIVQKQSFALNSLGVATFFMLLYDPYLCLTLGFQFSSIITASILLGYPIIRPRLITQRSVSSLSQMSFLDQHCYCLLAFFREAMTLAVAVNLTAFPLTLYFFQKFPVLSLFYNLFIPFLVSLSMMLLLVAALTSLVLPPLGNLFFAINSTFTHFMLNFIYQVPANIQYTIRTPPFPVSYVVLYLCALFFVGVICKHLRDRQLEYQQDLVFI